MSTVMSPPEILQFGEPRWHVDGALLALAYAADGTLWSVEEPGALRQWDPDGNLNVRHLLSDLETLWEFSPKAELLASASDDLVVWEVANHHRIATIPQPSWVTAVAFHPTRRAVATGHDDGSIRIWELHGEPGSDPQAGTPATGSVELSHHKQPISALAFNNDGTMLASASEDRQIGVWDLPAGKLRRTLTGHSDRIPALAWQPGTNLLLSAGWDTTVRIWDLNSGEPALLLNTHSDQVYALAFNPDGSLLAVADSSGSVHIWSEIAQGKELRVLPGDIEEIHTLAFSPDSGLLAVGGDDQVIHIWDPRTGTLVAGQAFQEGHLIDVCPAHPPLLVSNGGGTLLQAWDVTSQEPRPPAGLINKPSAVACSPDGRWIAITNADPDSRLHIWDNQTKQLRPPVDGPRAKMTFATFAPDSKTLATCCRHDGTAWLWNSADGEPKLIVPEAAEGCTVEVVAFHPTQPWLACGGIDHLETSGGDGAVTMWNVDDQQKVATFPGGALSLAFDPTGSRLAVASPDSTIYVWDVASQEIVHEIAETEACLAVIAFSPDGKLLIAGCDDHTLRSWDVTTWRSLSVLEMDTPIRALRFSPDGQTLYTGNGNTTCYAVPVAWLLDG